MKRTYRLKPMVVARLLVEVTVLSMVVLGTLLMCAFGLFEHLALPWFAKPAAIAATVVAAFLLPFYGFITARVSVKESGFKTWALFERKWVEWQSIRDLKLRSGWGWRRYVVTFNGDVATFPIWLDQVGDLVATVRSYLPAGSSKRDTERAYDEPLSACIIRYAGVVLCALFAFLFWMFAISITSSSSSGAEDRAIVVVAAVLVTVWVSWRAVFSVLLAPRCVRLKKEGLTFRVFTREETLRWDEVQKLRPTSLLLPEGFILQTTRTRLLLSNRLDDYDLLLEAIQEKLREHAVKFPGPR